ncbi:MAG: hypothetical protein H6733_07350 [Alphaproteobacteria bacterium]|nr:hypothetical protein [Alphaproteobacteria bacterium]
MPEHGAMAPGRHWNAEVDGAPDQVRARIVASCLRIRSLWFTSLAEQRAWARSTDPLFLRGPTEGTIELGPRLSNLQAARLAPVLHLDLVATGDGRTRLQGRFEAPRFAFVLLALWGATMVLAAGAMVARAVQGAAVSPPEVVAWCVIAGGVGVAAWIGWRKGGEALRAALPELARRAGDPDAGADDW